MQSAVITLLSVPVCRKSPVLKCFAPACPCLPACLPQSVCFCQLLPVLAPACVPALASQALPAYGQLPIAWPLPLLLPLSNPLLGSKPH